MRVQNRTIITCAITGSVHPSTSAHLPVTPAEITEAALGARKPAQRLDARNPQDGRRPDQTPDACGRFLPQIKQASNAVVNLTTGGAA